MARPESNSRSQSLQQLVERNGPLAVSRAATYVEQTARQLSAYHERCWRHGDVRPRNIFLNDSGQAVLGPPTNLEVDEILARDENLDLLLYAVDYLAPEVAICHSIVDGRSDQYSLGCTFYYLLTGKPPFPTGSISERLLQHQVSQPPEVGQIRTDIPLSIGRVCMTMLEKKPADRYASAMHLAEMIRAWRMEGYL